MKGKDQNPLTVKLPGELAKKTEKLFVYVVDNQGNLIEKAAFREGNAQLISEAAALHGKAKIYIAPAIPPEVSRKPVTERMLKKMNAYQPYTRVSADKSINLDHLPEFRPGIFKRCNITGTVTKTFRIDGIDKVKPLCKVKVHICEIDPVYFIMPHIPDIHIIDIRDKILDVIIHEKIPVFPDPPIPDPIGPVSRLMKNAATKVQIRQQQEMKLLSLPVPPDPLVSGLSSYSIQTVRQTLHDHYKFLIPYFCLFPHHWPFLYHCDEIATVTTDCNGRYEYHYIYFPTGDQPDIYVWVEADINGTMKTIYKPGKPCGTYWNYHCGTDINIRIPDSVEGLRPCECEPLPGQAVWMKRVNDGISIRNIQQLNGASGHIGNAIGLTNDGTGRFVSPFGLSFPFVVQFSSGLPSAGVTHYRWRYRQLTDANLSPVAAGYTAFEGYIAKRYTFERINAEGDTVFYTDTFKLGPFNSPNGAIFRIPHVEASVDVPAEPTAEWDQDTYSVYIPSTDFNNGLYEFLFELLDNNGNVVPCDKDIFVVDKKIGEVASPPDAPTVTAYGKPENYLFLNGFDQAIGFKFVLRVDNQVCFADIKDALVDGAPTQSVCGFGQYNDKLTSLVTLRFEASHPQNFATYAFSVVKGNGNSAGNTNTSDYVTETNNGYSLSGDTYSKNLGVAEMLGECDKAAFAENLGVYALHTNGNRRVWEYDRYDVAAFAIEPVGS